MPSILFTKRSIISYSASPRAVQFQSPPPGSMLAPEHRRPGRWFGCALRGRTLESSQATVIRLGRGTGWCYCQAIVTLDGKDFYLGPMAAGLAETFTTVSPLNGLLMAVGCRRMTNLV
jgi:hypothetical protein